MTEDMTQFQRIASDGNLLVSSKKSDHASDSDLTFEPSSVSSQPTWQRSQSSMSLDTHRTKNRSLTLSERTTSNSHGQCHDSVAEHSKVYLDLSKAGDSGTADANTLGSKFKISLQTIHQKEEMTTTRAPPTGVVLQKQHGVVRRAASADNNDQSSTGSSSDSVKYAL